MSASLLRRTLLCALTAALCACQGGTDDGLPRAFEGPLECGRPAARIGAIQGVGALSPALGRMVEVEAVVTARFSDGLGGFFIATEPGHDDQNPATSEGLFVREENPQQRIARHARLRLRGRVAELGEAPDTMTALVEVADLIECGEPVKLMPVSLTAAPESLAAFEALEGQHLRLPGPLSVTGNDELLRNGQLTVSFDGRDFVPTEISAPGPEAQARNEANQRTRLLLDDGQLDTYPQRLWYLPQPLTAKTPWRVDSQVSGVSGVLEQRDGGWRLQVTEPIAAVQQAPRPTGPPELDGDLSIASFNVLNYFNGDGKGGGFPTERGAQTQADFTRQRDKIVAALATMHADVVALMEIENDGFGEDSAIADLTVALNRALGDDDGDYDFVRVDAPAIGTDRITVGMLFRRSRVQPLGPAAMLAVEPFIGLGRPPLAQSFQAQGVTFTVVANHFKSKGGCDDAEAPDRDQGDGQGCWNATRVSMAQALWNWLQTDPTGSGSANYIALGDFNAHGEEDPIRLLKSRGLRDLVGESASEPAYSYVYRGESGRLDHALASPGLAAMVSRAAEWHINADEAPAFEYGAAGHDARSLKARYRRDPFRSADHDPVLIGLALPDDSR
jgi:predicted extracellular nuclease